MKLGFTKDRLNYTFESDPENRIWTVASIPAWWDRFGRPARQNGDDGMMGNRFYPLRVLHSLKA